MKIQTIHVNGFGRLTNRTFDITGPLTVFYGPNEAGKSTLLGFVRSMLFGIPNRQHMRDRFEPANGGPHGGSMILTDENGRRLTVRRYERGTSASASTDEGSGLYFDDGTILPLSELDHWIGGLSQDVFRQIFAFSLSELQEIRTLQSDEVSGYLYGVGMGISGNAVLQAEKQLTSGMDKLFKPKGRNQDISHKLQQLSELEKGMRKSNQTIAAYNELTAELQQLEQVIASLEQEEADTSRQHELVTKGIRLWEPWIRMKQLKLELEQLTETAAYPKQAIERYEHHRTEALRINDELNWKAQKREQVQATIQRLTEAIRPDALAQAAQIKLLYDQIPSYQKADQSRLELNQDIEHLESQLHQILQQINEHWTVEELQRFPISIAMKEQIRGFRDRIADMQAELSAANQLQERTEAEMEALSLKIRDAEGEQDMLKRRAVFEAIGFPNMELGQGLERIEQIIIQIEHVLALKQKYESVTSRVNDLKDQLQREIAMIQEKKQLQTQLLQLQTESTGNDQGLKKSWIFRILLLLGGVANLMLPAYEWQQGNWKGAVLIAVVIALMNGCLWAIRPKPTHSGSAKRSERQFPSEAMDSSRSMLDAVQQRLSQAEMECTALERQIQDELAALRTLSYRTETYIAATATAKLQETVTSGVGQLDLNAHRLNQALQDYSQARDELKTFIMEQRMLDKQAADWKQDVRIQLSDLQHIREQINQLKQSEQSCKLEWHTFLTEHHLSDTLTPELVLDMIPYIEQAKKLLQQKEAYVKKRKLAQSQMAVFDSEVDAWMKSNDDPSSTADPVFRVRKLMEELDAMQQADKERDQQQLLLHELNEQIKQTKASYDREQKHIQELWAALNADDEETFRQNALLSLKREELAAALGQQQAVIEAWQGDWDLAKLQALFQQYDLHQLQEQQSRLGEQQRQLRVKLNETKDQRGRLRHALEQIEQGEEHAHKLLQLQETAAELQTSAKRWAIQAMALELIKRAREVYERERQPNVLLKASSWMRTFTNGAYTKIVSPLEQKTLRLLGRDGQWVDAAFLSRGTAEQLYLAMRFALADEFAHARGVSLPMIMDDIFVNFDDIRLASCIDVMAELSSRHQWIIFTCHEHVKEAFMRKVPDCQIINLTE